jgi:predicted SAM-dependent methyltransferase
VNKSGYDVKLLNIGCGNTYHHAWVNIDVEPVSPDIRRHDAGMLLPFEDNSYDACYCSHVLEHLYCNDALFLLKEIYRILKPGGIVRVVVPDLEDIVRTYLSTLEQTLSAKEGAEHSYDWIVLELIDQMVRNTSGGQMEQFIRKCPVDAREFVQLRIGNEAERIWKSEQRKGGILLQLQRKSAWWFFNKIRFSLVCCFARLIGGRSGLRSVREGWFRTSGEVHRWMYDRFSLGRLLENAGFNDVSVCSPDFSRIPQFSSYGLDVIDGEVRKPDSLFMEGVCS